MFERFTGEARATVVAAQSESRDLGHPQTGTEHLLLGLLTVEGSVAHRLLTEAGLTAAGVRVDIERLVAAPQPILSDEDAAALRTVGIDLDAVLARIEQSFGPSALTTNERKGRRRSWTRLTPRARKVLELSLREALRLKHKHIAAEHILLGLIREREGRAARIMTDAGVSLTDLKGEILAAITQAA